MDGLARIIEVDSDKCVNCHACIGACPVKYCNDGSGDHVTVNKDLCIGCGSCITACTHEARYGIDDIDAFIKAAESGEQLIAVVAPSVAANFPGLYLHFNGWLKALGIQAVFDVSFGAELTIKSYKQYVTSEKPKTVISQPCPAIVSYIQIYQPELIPSLAPADSPMLHTIKMVKEYYPKYEHHRVLVVSPCYAKRREFDETGFGQYNVTYISFEKYLRENEINLEKYPKIDYDNRPAERAVLFSTPGGLLRTMEREAPAVSKAGRKIEGPEIMYDYLKKLPEMIDQGKSPLVVDCLNCEKGCNGGTGTLYKDQSPDELEYWVEQRSREMIAGYKRGAGAKGKIRRTLKKYWRPGLYARTYTDFSSLDTIRKPTDEQLQEIYTDMHKYEQEDFLNCGACGYGKCEAMAVAIFNRLNKPENCFHYERRHRQEMADSLLGKLKDSTRHLTDALGLLTGNSATPAIDGENVDVSGIAEIAENTRKYVNEGVEYVQQTLGKIEEIQETSIDTVGGIKNLGEQIKSIWEIVGIINSVASQTKIIAFNAELEASAAGEKGKNFEIVASEIRRLADNTVLSTQEIKEKINEIQRSSSDLVIASEEETKKIREGHSLSGKLRDLFTELMDFTDNAADKIKQTTDWQVELFNNTLTELSSLSREIDELHD